MFFGGFKIVLLSYLLGSIPFGFLIARMRGLDIRQHGSGNIGATNVLRVMGKKFGIPVFLLDAVKGLVAVGLAKHFALAHPGGVPVAIAAIMGAICCILGHNFPVWLGFKGGKGIATSAGVLIGMLPLAALGIAIVWMIVFYSTRYVSLASICAALSLPVIVLGQLFFGLVKGWPFFYFALAVGLLAVWRHRSNIQRLLNGTEARFEKKKKENAEQPTSNIERE